MKLEVITREPQTEPKPVPLLFVHGSCHAAWCWEEHFLDYFASHGYSSHALSLRGHGQSEGRENLRWTSVKDYVRDVAQVAGKLSPPPVLIGHSLGGLVVQKYLEKYRTPAAVLIAPSPASGMFSSGMRLFVQRPLPFVEVFLTLDFHPLFGTPARAQEMLFSAGMERTKVKKYAARAGSESLRAGFDMIFYLPRPKRIKSPLLVLGAADDVIVRPREIRNTARAYHADHEIFPHMAHDMMLEDGWEDVAGYMLGWLKARGL